jgi:hypothetical protein
MTAAVASIAHAWQTGVLEVTRLAEGSGVVLHVPSLRSRTLNPAGMLLLDALAAGAETANALADRLTAAYEIDRATAARDAESFLSALSALLEPPA